MPVEDGEISPGEQEVVQEPESPDECLPPDLELLLRIAVGRGGAPGVGQTHAHVEEHHGLVDTRSHIRVFPGIPGHWAKFVLLL